TEFPSPDVSLAQLKDVIDPLNWNKCLSSFFCKMTRQGVGQDGWSRVLEEVSTTCGITVTHIRTPLVYWKGDGQVEQSRHPTAFVEYALDEHPSPDAKGDGLFVVDEGVIRMTSTAGDSTRPGVRVRTRKVAGIRNLSATPFGVLACALGYGDQGVEMLI